MSGLEYGSKADSLRALSEAGLPVPDAFFLCTAAYRAHANAAGVPRLLAARSGPLDGAPVADAIVARPVSHDIESQLYLWFADLGGGPLAVRSSANAEDLPEASFAGQHGTYFVTSAAELVRRVRDCWASLFSERAVRYREHAGIPHSAVEMGVVVQRLVDARASGVAFSADPVSGERNVVVEACPGLGEALVSGKVSPDRFVIARVDAEVLSREPGDKPLRIVRGADGGVVEEALSPEDAAKLCIDDEVLHAVVHLVLQAEDLLGTHADIEWTYDGQSVWLLQARPITTLPPLQETAAPAIWSNVNTGEILPDVITPFTWSVIHGHADDVFGGMFGALGLEIDAKRVIGLVGGRVYFNLSLIRESFASIPTLDIDRVLGGMHDYVELPDLELEVSRADRRRSVLRAARTLPRYVSSHRPAKAPKYAARLRAENDRARARLEADMDSREAWDLLQAQMAKFEQFSDTLAYMAVAMLGFGALTAVCNKWVGDDSGAIANKLVTGRGDVASAGAGVALWELSVRAGLDDDVRGLVLGPRPWLALHRELEASPAGREFLRAWDDFMREHGHHRRGELEFFNPTWAELPDYVLDVVRSYLRRDVLDDPTKTFELRATEAEELAEKCRRELRNPFKRFIFERTLKWGRSSAGARENLKNEAVRWLATIREVLLVLGAQLTADRSLTEPEDVFFLTYEELIALMSDGGIDHSALVSRRRAKYEHHRTLTPPPVVVGDWDELTDGLVIPEEARALKGISVSAGIARGPARVFTSADDEQHVLAGEILVAPFTDPGWTPYFIPAAGIVMDMGGMLSHGSIIAREYGIPAVVNVGPATRIITTGQMIEVDGDHGMVRLLDAD